MIDGGRVTAVIRWRGNVWPEWDSLRFANHSSVTKISLSCAARTWYKPESDFNMNLRIVMTLACLILTTSSAFAARPNILIAIADDQSFPHASAYGDPAIETPGFDAVARNGVLFRNAFTPAPGCSPMRAAFLTGREIWQLREAGTHASDFPRDLPVFTEQLSDAGYHVGMTGKGWGPGKASDWPHNPAGKSYSSVKQASPQGISSIDYAANFDQFLGERQRRSTLLFLVWESGTASCLFPGHRCQEWD